MLCLIMKNPLTQFNVQEDKDAFILASQMDDIELKLVNQAKYQFSLGSKSRSFDSQD